MSGPRVLLADDEVPLRGMLAELLREEDVDVVGEVSDGRAAVTEAVRLRPDVVVLDQRMPHLDGVDATRMIRALGLGTRVVLLSAYDDEALKEQAAAAGADAYLVKGCPAHEVLDAVAGVTAAHGGKV